MEKKAGISTPGLKFPTPHGVGTKEVTAIATAYKAAEIEVKDIFKALDMVFCLA